MALTFEVYNDGGWVDLSDYVIASGQIPYLQRNRDYETIASVFSCTISQKTSALAKGDEVRIKSGATLFFSGHILKLKNDAARKIWRVQIASALYLLRNYNCNYSVLNADISSNGTDYNDYAPASVDHEGYPNVGVLYLLERMFAIAGLTLDVSGVESDVYFTTTFVSVEYDVLMKDIAIDERTLYAINQASVAKYGGGGITADKGLEITFLDFIKKFLSATGLFLQVSDALTYVVYNSSVGEVYTVADSDKYNYNSEDVTERAEGYSFVQRFGHTVGLNYRTGYNTSGTATVKIQREVGEGNETIDWYNHLFFMVRLKPYPAITDANESGGTVTVTTTGMSSMDVGDWVIIEGVVGMTDLNGEHQVTAVNDPTDFSVALVTAQSYTSGGNWKNSGAVYLDYHITAVPFTAKKVREIITEYTEERIQTVIDLTVKSVVENSIDFETQTSNIIQEMY